MLRPHRKKPQQDAQENKADPPGSPAVMRFTIQTGMAAHKRKVSIFAPIRFVFPVS